MLKPTAAHAIAIVLASAGACLHFLQANPEIANEIHMTGNGLLVAGFLVALASQSILGKNVPPLPLGLLCLPLFFVLGCLSPQPVPAQIAAGESVFSCVEQNWGQPVAQVVATCLPGEVALVEDVIADVEYAIELAEGVTIPDGGAQIAVRKFPFPYADDARVSARLAQKRAGK